MNGGHSASAMLQANPLLTVHSFDLMYWNYSWPVATMLTTAFGDRFNLHPGNLKDHSQHFLVMARARPARRMLVSGLSRLPLRHSKLKRSKLQRNT